MDPVRQQVMISQFVFVAGCRAEHARQLLAENNWHFEVFFGLTRFVFSLLLSAADF